MSAVSLPEPGGLLNARFTTKSLVYFQIIFVMVVGFLTSVLGLPAELYYVTDALTILGLLAVPRGSLGGFRKLGAGGVEFSFVLMCLVFGVGDLFHSVSLPLIVWSIRNVFRFFAFLYLCYCVLDLRDIEKIFRILLGFQALNVVMTILQVSQGYRDDTLGGVFGTNVGCNVYSNVFFCILLSFYALGYSHGRQSFLQFFFVLVSTLGIAAFAELKFFYTEAAVIVLWAFFQRVWMLRSWILIAGVGVFGTVALKLFSILNPASYDTLTDVGSMLEYTTDSSGAVWGYNIGRLSALRDINTFIFHDDRMLNMFGIGFGNAGYSSVSAFTSPFYFEFGHLNYLFFTHQTLLIETGLVGFSLYIGVFGALFAYCVKCARRMPEHEFYFSFVKLVIVLTVAGFWYNQAARIEASYLTFFVLAIPFVLAKSSPRSTPHCRGTVSGERGCLEGEDESLLVVDGGSPFDAGGHRP